MKSGVGVQMHGIRRVRIRNRKAKPDLLPRTAYVGIPLVAQTGFKWVKLLFPYPGQRPVCNSGRIGKELAVRANIKPTLSGRLPIKNNRRQFRLAPDQRATQPDSQKQTPAHTFGIFIKILTINAFLYLAPAERPLLLSEWSFFRVSYSVDRSPASLRNSTAHAKFDTTRPARFSTHA